MSQRWEGETEYRDFSSEVHHLLLGFSVLSCLSLRHYTRAKCERQVVAEEEEEEDIEIFPLSEADFHSSIIKKDSFFSLFWEDLSASSKQANKLIASSVELSRAG